jgi:hypothetical protein
MSHRGDLRKIIRRAREQGWRVEKRKEFGGFYPPDGGTAPAKIAGTPSSRRSMPNFLAEMKRKGYRR